MSRKVVFAPRTPGGFAQTVRSRVDAYFAERHLSPFADWRMYSKTAFFVGTYLALYACIVSGRFGQPVMLGLAILMGLFTAGIGFDVGHDASHGAFSSKPWVNTLFSHAFTLIGANPYNWNNSHNIVHHSYTNIPEADGDLRSISAMRFYPWEGKRPYHRFQYLYAFLLYPFTTLVWVTKKDFRHFFERRLVIYDKKAPPRHEYVVLFLGKLYYYAAFLVIPALLLPLPFWKILVGFAAMHAVAGAALALVFQLGHIVEGVEFPSAGEDGRIGSDWESHQVRTSADFATRNRLANFYCGGLNFQIEHHLFPRVCHVHYPAIAPIVKAAAAEFGVHYQEYPTFGSALLGHVRLMKRLGREEIPGARPEPAPHRQRTTAAQAF